ncbi:MAG: winged helix-turn-helix transcriptional regulator [Candidatus Heimdallarchaeota archaeon]
MVVEERDMELLIALQESPLAPASKLAQAVNLSTPTVITRLDLLKQDKSYYKVIAQLDLDILDMEIVDVLLQIEDLKNVDYFEKHICYKHPYTLFRSRCFGHTNGLYVQFRIPKNTQELLLDLFEHLKTKGLIDDYYVPVNPPNTPTIYTKANLASWQPKFMRWKFDWDSWIKKLSTIDSAQASRPIKQSILPKLDELDLALLQEITMSARRKNTEIMDTLKLDKTAVGLQQKISRKLKFLEKEIVSQYRVHLQWETFEIYNSFLVLCECDEETSTKLQNLLMKHPIPFESTFKLTETGFLWYLRCPATHFSNISAIVWKLSKKVKFYYLDYKKLEIYGLWKGAFDASNYHWSIDMMKKENLL